MQSLSPPDGLPSGLFRRSDERRKNPRFDLRFPVFLRAPGDAWTVSETADVSATGAFVVIDRPFLLNAPIEYVLTFPPHLTKAAQPLRVRFFGTVLRCAQARERDGTYGIALRNTAHRFLAAEESAKFDAIERTHARAGNATTTAQPLKVRT